MRRGFFAVVAGAALLAAGAAYAADTDNDNSSNNDPNQIICKSGPPPIGSRLGGARVCKTRLQWEKEREAAQRDLNDLQSKNGYIKAN